MPQFRRQTVKVFTNNFTINLKRLKSVGKIACVAAVFHSRLSWAKFAPKNRAEIVYRRYLVRYASQCSISFQRLQWIFDQKRSFIWLNLEESSSLLLSQKRPLARARRHFWLPLDRRMWRIIEEFSGELSNARDLLAFFLNNKKSR